MTVSRNGPGDWRGTTPRTAPPNLHPARLTGKSGKAAHTHRRRTGSQHYPHESLRRQRKHHTTPKWKTCAKRFIRLPPGRWPRRPQSPSEHGRSSRPPGRSLRVRVPPGPRELCERQHIHRLAGSEATLGAVMSTHGHGSPESSPAGKFRTECPSPRSPLMAPANGH